ncbi:MAG: hydroxyacid dehydrogenase [Alistipes sp.]|nr:hydroxyacid dehydrogenase [Alistipes sp.]
MAKIVFLDEYSLGDMDLSPIKNLGEYVGYERTSKEQVLERCQDAEVVICNKTVLRGETLRALPNLRFVAIAATGMNNVDLDVAAELGIGVKNVAGYSTSSVAEATMTFALSLLKNTEYFDNYFKSGAYAATEDIFHFGRPVRQLRGSRWGVIGMGAIGREVARLASAFGCEVAYTSTSGAARKEDYPQMPLEELLAWADVVSIHCPLTPTTRGLIGEKELAMMKPTSIIINVARGGIIDEEALANALNNKTIAGAGLDVFSREPLHSSPLYALEDNYTLVAAPHTAWAADAARTVLIQRIAENISEYLNQR